MTNLHSFRINRDRMCICLLSWGLQVVNLIKLFLYIAYRVNIFLHITYICKEVALCKTLVICSFCFKSHVCQAVMIVVLIIYIKKNILMCKNYKKNTFLVFSKEHWFFSLSIALSFHLSVYVPLWKIIIS